MAASMWQYILPLAQPPLDLSDNSSQLIQYERYIATNIEPQVTGYIMANTPLFLPSAAVMPTMTREALPSLTSEYTQQFTYFMLRLEGIVNDLKELQFNEPYWSVKRNKLVKDVMANHEWLRCKMDERIHEESGELHKKQISIANRIIGSNSAGGHESQHSGSQDRRDSHASNLSSGSTLNSVVVHEVEKGVTSMFNEDEAEERDMMQRWNDERAEREEREALEEPKTPGERVAQEKDTTNKSLEKYITAGVRPLELQTPPKSPIPTTRFNMQFGDAAADTVKVAGLARQVVQFDDDSEDELSSISSGSSDGGFPFHSSSRGGFVGPPHQRTWKTLTAGASEESFAEDSAEDSFQEDADAFFKEAEAQTREALGGETLYHSKWEMNAAGDGMYWAPFGQDSIDESISNEANDCFAGPQMTTGTPRGNDLDDFFYTAGPSNAPIYAEGGSHGTDARKEDGSAHADGAGGSLLSSAQSESIFGPRHGPRPGSYVHDHSKVTINQARVTALAFPSPLPSMLGQDSLDHREKNGVVRDANIKQWLSVDEPHKVWDRSSNTFIPQSGMLLKSSAKQAELERKLQLLIQNVGRESKKDVHKMASVMGRIEAMRREGTWVGDLEEVLRTGCAVKTARLEDQKQKLKAADFKERDGGWNRRWMRVKDDIKALKDAGHWDLKLEKQSSCLEKDDSQT